MAQEALGAWGNESLQQLRGHQRKQTGRDTVLNEEQLIYIQIANIRNATLRRINTNKVIPTSQLRTLRNVYVKTTLVP